jgi:hypothetical protein
MLKLIHRHDSHTPPAPIFPIAINRPFIQFEAWITIAPANFSNSMIVVPGGAGDGSDGAVQGIGEIQNDDSKLGGMVYADDLVERDTNFTFVLICHAPTGDGNFDYGFWDAQENPADNGDQTGDLVTGPPIKARKRDIWWVLMLDWYGQEFYQRAGGLGYIPTERRHWFRWTKEMVVIG